jgi:hypothetical protein
MLDGPPVGGATDEPANALRGIVNLSERLAEIEAIFLRGWVRQ